MVVCREREHDCVRVTLFQVNRAKAKAGCSVAPHRLYNEILRGQLPQLYSRERFVVGTNGDQYPLEWDQWLKPAHGVLQQRRRAQQAQKRFRHLIGAERPESLAAAPRHNDCVHTCHRRPVSPFQKGIIVIDGATFAYA